MAKTPRKKSPVTPSHFFAKQLPGEEPLTFETAQHLFRLASEIYGQQPWKFLTEDNLLFCPVEYPDRLAMVSVMGARGEFFSVMTYFGAEGYDLFRRMSEGDDEMDPLEYQTLRTSLHVEYVQSSELEKGDKELLRAMGHPARGQLDAPVFRSTRQGYVPWPVNELEGQTLAHTLAALVVFLTHLRTAARTNPWAESRFPLAVMESDWRAPELKAAITSMAAPRLGEAVVEIPPLDMAGVEKLLASGLLLGGPWEMDIFPTPVPIGGKARPFFAQCLMAVDVGARAVLHFNVFEPGRKPAEAMAEGVLAAIKESHILPSAIHVARPEFVPALSAVCKALDCEVKLVGKLAGLGEARREMTNFVTKGAR